MRRLFINATALVILDQISKKTFEYTKAILTDQVAIKYVENTGTAFGLIPNSAPFLVALGAVALALVAKEYFQEIQKPKYNKYLSGALILIFAGIEGNFLDRLLLGYVRDFISIWRLPVFNFSDLFLTVGAVMIIGFILRDEYRKWNRNLKKIVKEDDLKARKKKNPYKKV